MKYYTLKKDLPTFKAGDEFYLNNEGDLVSLKERVVAYSVKTLDKFPNILTNWFESANTGFYLDEEGCVVATKWSEGDIKTTELLKILPQKPAFGDKTGKTRWLFFVKNERSK